MFGAAAHFFKPSRVLISDRAKPPSTARTHEHTGRPRHRRADRHWPRDRHSLRERRVSRLVVAGRDEDAGRQLATELRALGAEAEFVLADVRHEEEVRALVDRAIARFGRLDVAVNAAGTEGRPGPVVEQTADSYASTFDTNVLGTLLSMKHELRVMLTQKRGSIINVSSTYGHQGAAGASVYVASKHAVEGMTKSAALEAAGSGVRVNAIAPGPVDTGMLDQFTGTPERKTALVKTVPLGRVGDPAEIASAAVFLASEAASFITGHILAVDGGKSAG